MCIRDSYLGGMSERACVGAGEVTSFVKSALYLVDALRGAYVSSRSRSLNTLTAGVFVNSN
jgi:hypothetical protein